MGIKRHRPEEIVTKLRQVEVLVGQGMARLDAIREVCITEQTFYRWRKQYGGLKNSLLGWTRYRLRRSWQARSAASMSATTKIAFAV